VGFPPAGYQWFAIIEASSFDILEIQEEFGMILHFPHSFSFPLNQKCPCFLVVSGIRYIEEKVSCFVLPIGNHDFDLLNESVMHSELSLRIHYPIRFLIVCV
jgi:hypothetical protein